MSSVRSDVSSTVLTPGRIDTPSNPDYQTEKQLFISELTNLLNFVNKFCNNDSSESNSMYSPIQKDIKPFDVISKNLQDLYSHFIRFDQIFSNQSINLNNLYKEQLIFQNRKIQALENQIKTNVDNNNSLTIVSQYEEQLNNCDEEIAELKEKLYEYENQNKEVQNIIEKLQIEVDNEKTKRIQLERVAQHAEQERLSLVNQNKELMREKQIYQEKEQDARSQVEELNVRANEMAELMERQKPDPNLIVSAKHNEVTIQQLNQICESLKEQLYISNQNEQNYQQNILGLEKELSIIRDKKRQSDSSKLQSDEMVDTLNIEIRRLNRDISSLNNQINILKSTLQSNGVAVPILPSIIPSLPIQNNNRGYNNNNNNIHNNVNDYNNANIYSERSSVALPVVSHNNNNNNNNLFDYDVGIENSARSAESYTQQPLPPKQQPQQVNNTQKKKRNNKKKW